MFKLFSNGFWEIVARLILRNRISILIAVALTTVFFSMQWNNMRFSYTEANLLPDDHPINLEYNQFLELFGEEGNLIVVGVKDSTLLTVEKLNAWNTFSKHFNSHPNVDAVIAIKDLQKLVKNERKKQFDLIPFIKDSVRSQPEVNTLKKALFEKYPFYDNILFNKETEAIRTAIYLDKSIVNTNERKAFIEDVLIPKVNAFEETYDLDVRVSGMPYVRTLNAQNIVDEISVFILAAILVTSLIFFFFYIHVCGGGWCDVDLWNFRVITL
jgi:predicted RND superfamily exporter protein